MEEIKGQKIPKKILNSIIKTGKFPSTFLFYGPPGVGKFSTALYFASEILKDKKKTFKGTHPDLAIIFPEFEGLEKNEIMDSRRNKEYFKLRQRKGHISIDTVRKLQDYTYLTPMENEWKIVIIAQADRITTEGFNAFLKILEEPPPNVIFILITTEKHFLPETIVSRSHTVRFSPLPFELQKEILKDESINRFGRGIEETLFLNSKKNLEERIEELFFSLSSKSRLKNWSEELRKEWNIESMLQYLQKKVEDKYKNKEITSSKAWNTFSLLKKAYRYYYSNISAEKIIFYLMLKV
ncbi:DNA polymerase III subunit [candidate division WOR-3 bacterium]|nr:DNA polymerase III subunit [candidate division WOR-3 bacterium]